MRKWNRFCMISVAGRAGFTALPVCRRMVIKKRQTQSSIVDSHKPVELPHPGQSRIAAL